MIAVRAMLVRSSSLLALALAVCLLAACSLVKHEGAQATVDAGAVDAAPASVVLTVIDAGPAPTMEPQPENVNEVGRFPDEVSLNDTPAKVADANVSARNAVPGGALVTTLKQGEPVTQLAKHGNFVLCSFADPKNPSKTLEGWVAEQAFVAGPTVPSKAPCPSGQTRLIFEDQDFCGRTCKADPDCTTGQVCTGKANLFANGKAGAETATCTIPLTPAATPTTSPTVASTTTAMPHLPFPVPTMTTAPTSSPTATATATASPTRTMFGVQIPPIAGSLCPNGFILEQGLCHRLCPRGVCAVGASCVRGATANYCIAN
jgi:hypothetical protein